MLYIDSEPKPVYSPFSELFGSPGKAFSAPWWSKICVHSRAPLVYTNFEPQWWHLCSIFCRSLWFHATIGAQNLCTLVGPANVPKFWTTRVPKRLPPGFRSNRKLYIRKYYKHLTHGFNGGYGADLPRAETRTILSNPEGPTQSGNPSGGEEKAPGLRPLVSSLLPCQTRKREQHNLNHIYSKTTKTGM